MADVDTSTSPFEKARTGLWLSLQKHLMTLYAIEKAFLQSVSFTNSFPFSAPSVNADLLSEYWTRRSALRDLYTDEAAQLDTLTKAIRNKGYSEDEKKQLYLMLLGYIDIAGSVFNLLDTHVPTQLPEDLELTEIRSQFERVKSLARFYIKGLPTGLISASLLK